MTGSIDDLTKLFSFSGDAANRTRSNDPASPCVTCKRSVTLLPLRYGVIGSDDQKNAQLLAPDLPATLGKRLKAVPLKTTRYAVRWLREGYVYVFVKRRGKSYACEAAYHAETTGLLLPVWPDDPGTPMTGAQGLGDWTIMIGDPEDIDEARLLFNRDPLSPAMLARYRDTSVFRERLQKFDLRTLTQSCANFDDVVAPESLSNTVAEYLATAHKSARHALETQPYPPFRSGVTPGTERLDLDSTLINVQQRLTTGQGFAVVLDDPIGIAQELNAWRNDAIETMRPWLQSKDAQGITNERRHLVAESLDNIKEAMQKGYIDKAVNNARRATGQAVLANAGWTLSPELDEQYQDQYNEDRVRARAARESIHAFDPYQKLLGWDGTKANVQREFAQRDAQAQQVMDQRCVDHLAWINGDAIMQAVDLYDRKEPVWDRPLPKRWACAWSA